MSGVSNTKAAGRLAGLVYLVIILFSIAGYVPMTRLLAGLLMATFSLAGVAMSFIALAHLLPLVHSSNLGTDAGMLAPRIRDYERVLLLAQVFSGLWLFPFGWLVLRSRVVPGFLGIALMVAGLFYLLQFATAFEPSLDQTLVFRIFSTAAGVAVPIGEFGICFWLLIKGAREPSADEPR